MNQRTNLPSEPRVYLSLSLLFVVLLLIMPRSGKFHYDYKKGAPWTYETLVAQFDFPILKTAEEIQEERESAGSNVIPYYRYSERIAQSSVKAAGALPLDGYPGLKQRLVNSLSAIYAKGIVAEESRPEDASGLIYIQRDKRASKHPAADVFTVSRARGRLLSDCSKGGPADNPDSVLMAVGAYDLLVPNLLFDKETTELVHAGSSEDISPTRGYVSAGQMIVSKGEIVTAEIQQMLDSYREEYEHSLGYGGPRFLLWSGNAVIALILCLVFFLSVLYTNPGIFSEMNRYLYLMFIVTLFSVLALLMDRINPNLLYMMPFTLSALYLMAFFRKRVVLPVYILSLLPLLIFAHNGTQLFVMNLVAGVVTMYVFDYFNKGWRQFLTALIAFAALVVTYVGFRLIDDAPGILEGWKVLYLFIAALLSVFGYPLIYLFEKVFMLVSVNRLVELCDTNNPLLVDLAQKAPGTFQHCLQVMNMAETAARSIDADVALVRAGALYHDIGKISNPQCFIENESLGVHYHEGRTPQESARDIIRHVDDGLALADRYNLPGVVRDFIQTHHGTTCTGYFYNRYLNEGGDPAGKADFQYHGKKPATKEQVIVMLSDTLEAASRSLKDNRPETFDTLVEELTKAKMEDGQFDEADITLKELGTVKKVLKSFLGRLYHERVAYPKPNTA